VQAPVHDDIDAFDAVSVATADLTGNGIQDIIVRQGDGGLSILVGSGIRHQSHLGRTHVR